MKKHSVLILSVFCAVLLSFTGCTSSTPATPDTTPYVFDSGDSIGNFENQSLSYSTGGLTATFSASNDSADGGTSPVPVLGVTGTDGSTGGSYMLAMTATVNTTLAYPLPGSLYALSPSYTNCGYVALNISFNKAANLLQNNNIIAADSKISSSLYMQYKVFFYNTGNQVAYNSTWTTPAVAFAGTSSHNLSGTADASAAVPAGSLYTASDVLSSVKKIVIVFRYMSWSAATTTTFTLFMDDFRLLSTI